MDKEKLLKKLRWIEKKTMEIHDFVDDQDLIEILPRTMGVFVAVGDVIKEMESKPKKESIKMMNIPKDANLTEHITLEEENNRLREAINSAIQCLTSGNSVMVSDPRPALKYLKEGLK